jgi:hypothetical protein
MFSFIVVSHYIDVDKFEYISVHCYFTISFPNFVNGASMKT